MLGITVSPEYIQSEGVEKLLDNLQTRAPVTAISILPYVMSELPAARGGEREPPADAGKGLARLLDRPLWGKREVWIEVAPSYEPDLSLYEGLRYQPSPPTSLTDKEGGIIDSFIEIAQTRGLKVYFQIQSAIPPGYRVQCGGPVEDDAPRLPDGSKPLQSLDKNGSLASPHIIGYGEALTADLVQRYPDINGIRIDWPEYPPYFLDSIFLDFSHHVKSFAEENGFEFERIRENAEIRYHHLREGLSNEDLARFIQNPQSLIESLQGDEPGIQLKLKIVSNFLLRFRKAMDAAGGTRKELIPSAFPPPWNQLSGFDYSANSKIVDAISCKYYTMHWPMMLGNYSDGLTENNPSLSKSLLAQCLCAAFDAVAPIPLSCDAFHYPEPAEAHPVSTEAMGEKQKRAETEALHSPVWPIAHSYGPTADFARRTEAVYAVSKNALWINRYGYLTDEKLDALGEIARS